MKSSRSRSPVLAVVLALLASCGGSDDGVEAVELSLRTLVLEYRAEAAMEFDEFSGTAVEPADEDEDQDQDGQEDLAVADEVEPCDDVQPLRPAEATRPSGSLDLDSDLLTTLSGYGEANEETFAGLWLDGESNGGILLAFTDEPEPHQVEIMEQLGGDVWDAPFSVVEVPHSQADLELTMQAALRLRNQALESAAIDLQKNRVVLHLVDPTEAELASLMVAVDLDQVCGTIIELPDLPDGPLAVLPQAGGGSLLSCDEYPFPATALEDLVPASDSDHPAAAVLAPFIDGDPDWIVLATTDEHALFAKYDDQVRVTALAAPAGSGWEISGWTFGCDLRVGLPFGLGAVEIFLDPASRPSPEAKTVDVVLSEVACAGGRLMGKRLLGPQVIETETEVILAYGAVTQPVEFVDCPSNPTTKATIELTEPLGARTLVDGMFLPPRPLDEPRFQD